MKCSPSDSGFSLLDLLVGSMLGLIIIAATSSGVRSYLRATLALQKNIDLENRLNRAELLLESVISAYDSHPLVTTPIVQNQGEILFNDNTPNPIMKAALNLRPSNCCRSISTFALTGEGQITVNKVQQNGSEYIYSGCLSHGLSFSDVFPAPPDEMAFLALHPDGQAELTGSFVKDSPSCGQARLKETKSMLNLRKANLDLLLVRTLIPIARNFTLYTARSGELRYLGHRGALNLENQPLIDSVSLDSISIGAGLGTTILRAQISSKDKNSEVTFVSSLKRGGILNTVLNRP